MGSGGWDFDDEEDKKAMLEEVTRENCVAKLALVRKKTGLSGREMAKMMGLSEATLRRIEKSDSLPTQKFMDQLHALCQIGRARFEAMSASEKEKISESIGTSGGVVAGVGGAVGAVSAAGVSGLSAAGITSGLAAIGGGTMLAGIAVVAAIPVGAGLAGFGLVKAIKKICELNNLNSTEVDGRWEIRNIPPKGPPTTSALPSDNN